MEEPVLRRFVRYLLPSIFSMVGLSCYILADTFFVSNKVGAIGLAALNFAIPMYNVVNATGLMLGMGGATKYAFHRARKEPAEGNSTFSQMICLGAALSGLFVLLGWFAAEPLAMFLGADETAAGLTSVYLMILLSFSLCFIINNILVAFIRNDDAPRLAMIAMVSGSLTNVVLDYLLIYPLDMGMFGAALATGISPVVSLLILITGHILRKKNNFRFSVGIMSARAIGKCCSLGISAFIGEISSCVVILVFNLVIFNLAGNFGVAAYGIVANVAYVVISIFSGITQGAQPLLSDYYARGMHRQEKQVLRWSLMLSVVIGGSLWMGVSLYAPQLADIFNSEGNAALKELAVPGLRIYFIGFWMTGINLMLAAFFAAVERTKESFAVSLMRGLIGIVALVLLLSHLFGMNGVWSAFPATEAVTLLLGAVLYARLYKKQQKNTL